MVEAFPTHPAVHGNMAPATQNQAMNALVFLIPVSRENQKIQVSIVSPLLGPASSPDFSAISCRQILTIYSICR
jgi:hypothetical protein